MNKLASESGFTLIELLVVIAVLGVLAGVVFVAINPSQRIMQARDAQRKNDIGSLTQGVESYITLKSGTIPVGANGPFGVTGGQYRTDYSFQSTFVDELVDSGFIKLAPSDPLAKPGDVANGGNPYYIYYQDLKVQPSGGAGLIYEQGSYILYAYLENRNDGDCLKNTDGSVYTSPSSNMGNFCAYMVANGVRVAQWNP